jgi:hypothetical protein
MNFLPSASVKVSRESVRSFDTSDFFSFFVFVCRVCVCVCVFFPSFSLPFFFSSPGEGGTWLSYMSPSEDGRLTVALHPRFRRRSVHGLIDSRRRALLSMLGYLVYNIAPRKLGFVVFVPIELFQSKSSAWVISSIIIFSSNSSLRRKSPWRVGLNYFSVYRFGVKNVESP